MSKKKAHARGGLDSRGALGRERDGTQPRSDGGRTEYYDAELRRASVNAAAAARSGIQVAQIGSGTEPQQEHADGTRRSGALKKHPQPVDDLTNTGGSDQDNRPLADRWELKPETKEPYEP